MLTSFYGIPILGGRENQRPTASLEDIAFWVSNIVKELDI